MNKENKREHFLFFVYVHLLIVVMQYPTLVIFKCVLEMASLLQGQQSV